LVKKKISPLNFFPIQNLQTPKSIMNPKSSFSNCFQNSHSLKILELCCCYSSFQQPSYASEEEDEKFAVAIVDDEEASP